MPLRFHVVALPHTQTSKEHCACAYTQKVLNLCRMMRSLGHTVYHYGAEGSQVHCDEHVEVISRDEQRLLCGPRDYTRQCYDLPWAPQRPWWQLFNSRASVEILRRKRRRDFLCLIGGWAHKPIADAAGEGMLVVEFGIGYSGAFAPYRVFESYAHMAKCYGSQSKDPDGRFYDAVIPNYYDPVDFPVSDGRGDYYLYVGRLVKRKGIQIAVEATRQIGAKLLLAGQGAKSWQDHRLVCDDGMVYEGQHLEFVGHVDVQRRAELMGRATALLVPTLYLEPFGGVAVEAQLCGTPVISTDWGAFPETVEHGRTGYRCHTLAQFAWAARAAPRLDRHYIRQRALATWSIERVRYMYHEYFGMLSDLWEQGWYTSRPREQLDWLVLPSTVQHQTDGVPA